MSDPFQTLADAINKAWCDRYPGPPVSDPKQLAVRVEKLAEDRDCWMDNAKANQKEYLKLEKRLNAKKND